MLLAIDSSLPEQIVALVDAGRLIEVLRAEAPRGGLAGRIAALLERKSLTPERLQAVAVASGPGVLTGLRVGVATALGLAQGLRCPLFSIPSLEIAAARASPGPVAVLRAAGRGEVFAAAYDGEGNARDPMPYLAFLSELRAWWRLPERVIVEAAPAERARMVADLPPGVVPLREEELAPRAVALAARAAARLAAGATVRYDEIRLLYGQRRPGSTF